MQEKCWWQGALHNIQRRIFQMGTLFSTCLLVGDGSNAPELVNREVNLHPGDVFTPDQGENLLLAGAFPSSYQESGILLSPTLFMNSRLSSFGEQALTRIAVAEYDRANEVDFKSWTVEPDNRVCVVSQDASKLETFLDTYGGLLEISPLLLAGSHPEIDTAVEINVDSRDGICRIDSRIRSMIDLGRCSYCAECGRSCPENCISPTPYIDLNLCTMCKECEKICPTGAIDLHGVIERSMKMPALIYLDQKLPDNLKGLGNVYSEAQLKEYLASLFAFQMEETITWSKDLCHYSGRHGRGCDLCLSSCPHGAISQDEKGVTVDTVACVECGGCLAACPTGALQNGRFDDESFLHYFKTVSLEKCSTIVIGCEENLRQLWWQQGDVTTENTFFLEYEPEQGLSTFHYLYLFSLGISRVIVLRKSGEAEGAQQKQIGLTNELVEKLYDRKSFVSSTLVSDLQRLTPVEAGDVIEIPEAIAQFDNRRTGLVAILGEMVLATGRTVEMQPEGYIPFATVRCDESRCTQCMACLNECRIQALHADEEGISLHQIPARCVGCGLCAMVCPENALAISSSFTLEPSFFENQVMADAEPMVCKQCGKVFGTQKGYERVMAILSKKEAVDTSHFQYCDTCRVTRLFEAHE